MAPDNHKLGITICANLEGVIFWSDVCETVDEAHSSLEAFEKKYNPKRHGQRD